MAITTGTLIVMGIVAAVTAYKAKEEGDANDQILEANDEALAYQKAQDAKREEAMQAWQGNREALLRRWGVDIGSTGMPTQVAQGQPRPSAAWRVPMSIADREAIQSADRMPFNGGQPPPVPAQVASDAAAQVPVGATVGDLAQRPPRGAWNDWEALGLRRG